MIPEQQFIEHYYEFGSFRLSPEEGRLYREAEILALSPKVFELLLILVQNPGRVLSRETLMKMLWPDAIVEEANLNVHISSLRKALGEAPNSNQFIETLPRRGYRFIAAVSEIRATDKPAVVAPASVLAVEEVATPPTSLPEMPSTVSSATPVRNPKLVKPGVFLLLGALVAGGYWLYQSLRAANSNNPLPVRTVVPLTSYPGREYSPSFSPDGVNLAFVWSGVQNDNLDIYVRMLEGSDPVRLTNHPADDLNPVWSPDGRQIAFYRQAEEGNGVFVVPALGGAERKLTEISAQHFALAPRHWIDWSRQNELVVSDKSAPEEPLSLYLLSPDNLEKRQVTVPEITAIGDVSPAFSPDGKTLAFVRISRADVEDLFVMPLTGGEPKQLTFDHAKITNLTWTPDGREIIFSSRRGGLDNLWRIPAQGGTPELLLATGNYVIDPAFAPRGQRLAWTQTTTNVDIARLNLTGESNETKPLIASTLSDFAAQYAPDGKRIVFVSNRSGNYEIWTCGQEGEKPVQLTTFRGPHTGSPRWSPDGQHIVFDSRPDGNADVYAMTSEGSKLRRLTTEAAEDIVPSWSHNGQWIYFASNRTGTMQIWKVPAEGGNAIRLTRQGGFEAQESPDGKWLYYTKGRGLSAIWRMPTEGGEETEIFDAEQPNFSRLWTIAPHGIYFAASESKQQFTIRFFNFATRAMSTVATLDKPLTPGNSALSVSPDGRWLLFPQITLQTSDLMTIEDFGKK